MSNPKAYSYIRFSTKAQALGGSLKRQLEMTEELATRHKLELVRSYRDLGISGFSGKNVQSGAFGKFRDAVRSGKIESGSWLIVENFDRISRQNPWDAFSLLAELIGMGIVIATVMPEMVVSRKSDNMGDLYMVIGILMRAHEESKMKSTRGEANWKAKRKSGKPMTAQCPAWLKLKGGEHHPIPERVEWIRKMFEWAAEMGDGSIAAKLNEEGVETWGRGKRKAAKWHSSYIKKILCGTSSGRHVLGEYQPHKMVDEKRMTRFTETRHKSDGEKYTVEVTLEPVPDYFPQIIEDDVWYRAQTARKRHTLLKTGRPSPRVRNLFGGLLKCYCGHSFTYSDKGGGLQYLACSNPKCAHITWPYAEFERVFLDALANLYLQPVAEEEDCQALQLRKQIASAQGRVIELDKSMDELQAEFQPGRGAATRLGKMLDKMEDEAFALRERVSTQQSKLRRLERADRDREAELKAFEGMRDNLGQVPVRSALKAQIGEQVEKVVCWPKRVKRPRKLDLRTAKGREEYAEYIRKNTESFEVKMRDIDWERRVTLKPVEPTQHLRSQAGQIRAQRWASWRASDKVHGVWRDPSETDFIFDMAERAAETEKLMQAEGVEPLDGEY